MTGTTEHQLALFGGLSLQDVKTKKEEANAKRVKIQEKLKDPETSTEEKHHLQAVMHMETTRGLMLCPACFLLPGNCCCKKWHRVAPLHRVCVYMHHNEWGRGINSGIVLKTSAGAGLYMSGHRDMEAELKSILEANEERVFILWPPDPEGRASTRKYPFVSAHDLCALYPEAVKEGITKVAIDATWKNARAMVKRLPGNLKRVYIKGGAEGHLPDGTASIPATSGSLLRPVRKYKGFDGRVSTLEAVVGLLRFVGESEDVCEKLLHNLKMKVDAVQCQKHLPAIYATNAPPISGPRPDFSEQVPTRRNRTHTAGTAPIKDDDDDDNKPIKEEEGVGVADSACS